jgi:hypothetical protein
MMRRYISRSVLLLGAVLSVGTLAFAQIEWQQEPAGAALRRGMRLIYSSDGTEQPAWVVDSVDLAASWQASHRPCSYIRFGATDVRRVCQTRDTLFSWNETEARLVPARPVGAHMSLRLPARSGGHVLFETAKPHSDTISGIMLKVLPTTVTTFAANGRALRRLRERYAPALATALGGVFEVPDSASPGGWLVQREFTLLRIEVPAY